MFNFLNKFKKKETKNEIRDKNKDKIFDMELKFPRGQKIIIITNEPNENFKDKIEIGYVSHIELITKNEVPVVAYTRIKPGTKPTDKEQIHITFTEPMIYSEELYNSLKKLKWNDRWNIYSHGKSIISDEEAKRKEEYNNLNKFRLNKEREEDEEIFKQA